MGLELLGAGAGAGQGLEQLIAQRRADELMRQQALAHALSAVGLHEDRQARLAQQKAQADSLAEFRRQSDLTRQHQVNLNELQQIPKGTNFSDADFTRFTNPQSGAAVEGQFGPRTDAGFSGLAGLMPIDRSQPSADQATPFDQAPQIPAGRIFKGTAQQQEKAAGLSSLDTSRKAAIDQATERAQQAWERIRLEGENQANRAALAAAAADLSRAKLETEREKNANAAAKTPQPQYFKDTAGTWHAGIFDKGQFSEVPLPKGFTPTKTSTASWWENIKGMFGGGGGDSGPSNVISNDPNWGPK